MAAKSAAPMSQPKADANRNFINGKLEVGMQKVKPSGAAFKQRAVYF